MKKSLVLVLSAILSTSILAGCKSTSTSEEQPTEKKEKSPVELKIWVGSSDKGTNDYDGIVTEEFKKNNPHVTIKNVVHEGDPGNAYFAAVAAGTAPDVIQVSFAMMDRYIKAGVVAPLNEYTDKFEDLKNYDQKYLKQFTVNNKLYGIPSRIYPMLFGYNKKLFADAGLNGAPKTWEEMMEYGEKLTASDKQQYGYGMLSGQWTEWFFQYYVWQAGGDLTKQNDDGTVELTFTDPAVIKAANYYRDLRKNKVIQSDITMKFEDLVKNFAAGKIAMMPFASDWIGWVTGLGMKPEDIGLAAFPKGPGGSSAAAVSGSAWVINPKSSKEKRDAAFEYIKAFTSKSYYEGMFKDLESKGTVNPEATVRTDVELDKIVKMNEEWAKVSKAAIESGRGEFAGKAVFGKYVDQAVQKVVVDLNSNIEEEFKKAQDLAAKEALEKYNSDAKASK
jgi:multiple sugar transport system substrate-binding protein